ncbi:monofunctional biosynthetic peptidoglycan transglycosylase [Roseomonas sp. OT10]|uniref:monofunctional biosynthetic peptidoglycan transglycosylase n=1 Tax=Roseomonas cutis TaxID=2897332 RepID=UPI001E42930A|nr:monofunctional biosynthetic peptidoglycan transglycosylase [Roseomonas sp. OT10]UFN47538.1 monofunctional biosynthetic peptidoglycan transglycosylase [Roseomonas sp. OT10]
MPPHPAAARPGRFPRLRRLALVAGLVLLLGPLVPILAARLLPVPGTPLMLLRAAQGYPIHQDWVPYERISPALARAVVAAEDNFFCLQSFGFDLAALREEVGTWWEGQRPRGASTITMQTAKNLLLWPGRDPVRKVLEAWLTPQIALLWPRQRVLEVYLNIVEFGPGIYGAEAAARAHFGKPASALSNQEAAQLAVVLPNPLGWSASRPDAALLHRARVIRQRVGQLGPLLDCLE